MSDLSQLNSEISQLSVAVMGEMKALRRDIEEKAERIEELEARYRTPGRSVGAESREQKAFDTFLRSGDTAPLRDLQTKEMSIVGGAAAGQAFVPELISSALNAKALDSGPTTSKVKRSRSSTSDYVSLLALRTQTGAWSSEAGTRSETPSLTIREIRPTGGERYDAIPVTNWLLQDSKFNVSALIADHYIDGTARALEAAVWVGTGSNQPTGMLNTTPTTVADSGSPQRGAAVFQYIDDTADNASDLIQLFFSLKAPYRRNAQFAMSSLSLASVRKYRDSGSTGQFLWQQNLASAVDAPDGLLLGKPVFTAENLGLIAASPEQFSVACGDFQRAYELVEVGPMTIIRDDVTVRGKTIFYLAQRWYGHPLDNDALKFLKA